MPVNRLPVCELESPSYPRERVHAKARYFLPGTLGQLLKLVAYVWYLWIFLRCPLFIVPYLAFLFHGILYGLLVFHFSGKAPSTNNHKQVLTSGVLNR